jgi:ubiquinone/menaquinone biosynthesis C-methylase UbiE
MHKYLILALSLCAPLHCMEQQIVKREPREWDAQAYEDGNEFQTTAFLYFLKTNNITTENRTIFDIGCGTGKLSAQLAEKATHVHGSDASKHMIDFAENKYGHVKNLSFEHCFAEDFQSQNPRQLALASFCVHWFEDKKQAFQRIHNSLELNGEFFANVRTSDHLPLEIIVATEMMPFIETIISFITGKSILELSGSSYPSLTELHNMLQETGFEIIKLEEQCFNREITEDDLIKLQWPVISSRPVVQFLPDFLIQPLFKDFISRYLSKLQRTDTGKFLDKYSAAIIHARKVKK